MPNCLITNNFPKRNLINIINIDMMPMAAATAARSWRRQRLFRECLNLIFMTCLPPCDAMMLKLPSPPFSDWIYCQFLFVAWRISDFFMFWRVCGEILLNLTKIFEWWKNYRFCHKIRNFISAPEIWAIKLKLWQVSEAWIFNEWKWIDCEMANKISWKFSSIFN